MLTLQRSAKGQLPIQEQCGSLDVGVESASDAIVTAFERRFAYPLSPSDARALLFCYTRGKDYQAIATVMNAELDSSSIDQLITDCRGVKSYSAHVAVNLAVNLDFGSNQGEGEAAWEVILYGLMLPSYGRMVLCICLEHTLTGR